MHRATAALLAGGAATATEALLTSAERAALGRAPYDPAAMARRLAARLGVDLHGQANGAGAAMRWTYGPSWGFVGALLADRVGRRKGAAALGLTLFGFEITSLPLTGATPPVRAWPKRLLVADAANCLVYAAVATRVYAGLLGTARRGASVPGR